VIVSAEQPLMEDTFISVRNDTSVSVRNDTYVSVRNDTSFRVRVDSTSHRTVWNAPADCG